MYEGTGFFFLLFLSWPQDGRLKSRIKAVFMTVITADNKSEYPPGFSYPPAFDYLVNEMDFSGIGNWVILVNDQLSFYREGVKRRFPEYPGLVPFAREMSTDYIACFDFYKNNQVICFEDFNPVNFSSCKTFASVWEWLHFVVDDERWRYELE